MSRIKMSRQQAMDMESKFANAVMRTASRDETPVELDTETLEVYANNKLVELPNI